MALLNKNRSRLLMGAGPMALAVSLTLAPERANAQAFQATETVADGIVTRNLTGTGTETIVVETDTAIVDWTPDEDGLGNALDFLPTGSVATFENGVNVTDFAILNRVLPSANGNITVFDGTVISQLRDALGGVSPGGTVVFFSPTGILVGANATFDVGNLIMTTLDPSATFNTWAAGGQTGQLDLVGAPSTTAQIIVSPGAQITATAENSYFALTAAEIQMFGTSDVNGSTAFVAGEQVNLTISNGLFDISIPVGTSVTTPIQVDGDVGGPSSTGIGDNHLIYAVSRAAIDPISMIFRGNLGFDPAASAGIVNGEIVLSANYEVNGRTVDGGQIDGGITQLFDADAALTPINGSVFVEDINATSSLFAIANEEVQVTAFMGDSSIDGNLTMIGRNFAELTTTLGNTFTVSGDVLVSASDYSATGDADAGDAFIDAIDGILDIAGNVVVRANAFVGVDPSFDAAGTGQGGFATIAASGGGSLTVTGTASVEAFTQGQSSTGQPGTLTGGIAQVFASNGGSIDFQSDVDVSASVLGRGGAQTQGGQAIVQALSDGGLSIDGDLLVAAFTAAFDPLLAGEGGDLEGQGVGGSADIFIEGAETIDIAGSVTLAANGSGADIVDNEGGDGTGGLARFLVQNGGVLNIGQDAILQASGFAGSGDSGGDGVGGFAQILLNNGGTVRLDGSLSMTADGSGGLANSGVVGAGGLGDGGNVDIVLDGVDDLFVADSVLMVADGDGGTSDLGVGGDALGGAARLLITAGGTANIVNDFIARGSATGGNGLGGGGAQGGIAGANAVIGAISIGGNASSSANADGGNATSLLGFGGDGGDALGGNAFLQANGSLTEVASVSIGGNATVLSNATGGDGGQGDGASIAAGNGGSGTGGVQTIPNQADTNFNSGAFLLAGGDNGNLSVTGTALANAVGIGGQGGSGGLDQAGGDGGAGSGGSASAGSLLLGTDGSVAAGTVSFSALNVIADGIGGDGGFGGSTFDPQGDGGVGTGGRALVGAQAGTLTATDVITISNGTGGSGFIAGDGFGGERSGIFTNFGGSYVIDSYSAFAFGIGGESLDGVGGNGVGGEAFAGVAAGSGQINGDLLLNVSGLGGDSGDGDGGDGTGGTANIGVISAAAGTGAVTGTSQVIADGLGGQASFDNVGGTGTGGSAFVQSLGGTTITLASVDLSADGTGGTGFGVTGGNGVGGEAFINSADAGSRVTIQTVPAASDFISADGRGGVTDGGTGVGGAGTGGIATLQASQEGTIELPADGTSAIVSADGFGANSNVDGGAGGLATGGSVRLLIDGGTVNAPDLTLTAASIGGSGGLSTANTDGGDAVGGNAIIDVINDGTFIGTIVEATPAATGGNGSGTGDGGSASGGVGQYNFANAIVTLTGDNQLSGGGSAGRGIIGGDATGADVVFTSTNSVFNILPDAGVNGQLRIGSTTFARTGSVANGTATGSNVDVSFTNTDFNGGSLLINAQGSAGSTQNPPAIDGISQGGVANVNLTNSVFDLDDRLSIDSNGDSSLSEGGATGTGGQAFLNFVGGTSSIDGNVSILANGFGGNSSLGDGGAATGGLAGIQLDSATGVATITGNTSISTIAIGGDTSANLASGGAAQGGESDVDVIGGGTLNLNAVSFTSNGQGGNSETGDGGAGTGGIAGVNVEDGSFLGVDGGYSAIANGIGGNGVNGGLGTGGLAGGNVLVGQLEMLDAAFAVSVGVGGDANDGDAGDGGDGVGGSAIFISQGTLTEQASITFTSNLTLRADGIGGSGGASGSALDPAGNGGRGFGGDGTTFNPLDPAFPNGVLLLAGADNGNISVAGATTASATGTGGDGGDRPGGETAGAGGVGIGGSVTAGIGLFPGIDGSVGNGTAQFGSVLMDASGLGGEGGLDSSFVGQAPSPITGAGGEGTGGDALFDVIAGSATVTGLIQGQADGTGGRGAINATGRGGIAEIVGDLDGSLVGVDASLSALGTGGDNSQANGGDGFGGAATIDAAAIDVVFSGDVVLDATGRGGSTDAALGGQGVGGVATIGIAQNALGTLDVQGNAALLANGFGGETSDARGTGGLGQGGNAVGFTQAGSTVTLGSAQFTAVGLGADGGAGGAGLGGNALIATFVGGGVFSIVSDIPLALRDDLNDTAIMSSQGFGGDAIGLGLAGGEGRAGTLQILVNEGGQVTLPADPAGDNPFGVVRYISDGEGGDATNGGVGGTGTGGLIGVTVSGGAGPASATSLTMQSTDFSGVGRGGDGNGDGVGGDAIGGTRSIQITNAVLTAGLGLGSVGAVGGAGDGAGGDATGGSEIFSATNADLNITGVMVLGTSATGGAGGEGGRATGGMTDFLLTDSNLTFAPDLNGLGGLTIQNETTGGLGTDGLGGDAVSDSVTVDINNSTFANGSIKVSTDAVGGAATGGDSEGGLGLSGAIFFNARSSDLDLQDGNVFSAVGTGGAADQGGDGVGRDVFVGIRQSNLDIPATGQGLGSLLLTSAAVGGQGNQQAGNANSGNASFFSDDGIINIGELTVSAVAFANSTIGGLGGQEAIAGSADVTFDTDSVANIGDLLLLANAINSNDRFARGGRASLFLMDPANASPDVSIQNLELDVDAFGGDDDSPNSIPGEFAIQATAGELTVGTLFGTAQGSELDGERGPSTIEAIGADIFVTDALVIDTLDDFEIRTGGGSIIGDPSMLDPSLAISLATDGVLRIFGDNDNLISFGGATLTALSRDIEIAAGARIGAVTMTFASTNTDDSGVLGGIPGSTGQGPTQVDAGYVLDAAELDRLELTNFSFVQPEVVGNEPNDPDLILRDILVEGEIGDAPGFITVGTDGPGGIMRVEGQVVFDNTPFGTSVSLFANERIEVVTPGGIAVLDSDGLPTGILFLGSNNIWAADDDLIGLLQDDPSFADRNGQLSIAAPGIDDPLGYIRGGSVLLGVGESLLVRNTGTEAETGGILVGDGGLLITSGEFGNTGPLDVFAYGARVDSSGQLITGEAFFNQVDFDNNSTSDSTAYTEESQFNNCVINSGECTITQAPAPPPPPTGGEQGEEGEEGEQGENPIEGIGNAGSVNNPAVVEAAIEAVEAAVEAAKNTPANEQEADTEFGVDFPGLLEAPLLTEDPLLEDPVASGGDSSLYSGNEGSPSGDGPSDDGGEE